MSDECEQILHLLRREANPENVKGMERYGINPKGTLGVRIPVLRSLAKGIGKNHELATELWDSGIHEARLLACFVGEPLKMTESQAEGWVRQFDSWDICDQCCSNLLDKTDFAYRKVFEWSEREEEFIKRAGFVLIAALAVHDKAAPDEKFEAFLPLIVRHAGDSRNFVKKAVNWALRQIGKRNLSLNESAIGVAKALKGSIDSSSRWVGRDACQELGDKKTLERLRKKKPLQ